MKPKNVVILGSTGSIGVNSLDVIRHHQKRFHVVGLSTHKNISLLLQQIKEFKPSVVAVGDTPSAYQLKSILSTWKKAPVVWNHSEGNEKLAKYPQADFVMCGMVGAAGLLPLVEALKAGKSVGLANKEALIVAGSYIMELSKKYKAPLIPVDSEHSAIYQCLMGHGPAQVKRLILTASGGPFYRYKKDLNKITVQQALAHPTWKMGSKITVDSATLMNKGLEAIEAHHLFGVPMKKIDILIHPQSIVHSLVEFSDNAILAQLSHPDMRLPIQYALTYPERAVTKLKQLRLEEITRLDFARPEFSRFPCLRLALSAGEKGGTAPVVLSSANEEAVKAFIEGKISFMTIPTVVAYVVKRDTFIQNPSLDIILSRDRWAREKARAYIESQQKRKK